MNGIAFKFDAPPSDGGFPILKFKLYMDNNWLKDLSKDMPHINTITGGMTLGNSYKIQISAVSIIGESDLSPATVFIYAQPPSIP